MSTGRDPFAELSRHRDPAPDPVVMRAAIGRSVDAFARRGRQSGPTHDRGTWLGRFLPSGRWRVPVGMGAFALVVLFVGLPVALQTLPFARNAGQEDLAPRDAPMAQRERVEAAPARMGARPLPAPASPPPAEQARSTFAGENVRVELRLSQSGFDLLLPDLGAERAIDSQGLLPGEVAEILDAFRLPDRDLVAIRLRVGDARFWRAYRPAPGGYSRDEELTSRLSGVSDRAEARQRLTRD